VKAARRCTLSRGGREGIARLDAAGVDDGDAFAPAERLCEGTDGGVGCRDEDEVGVIDDVLGGGGARGGETGCEDGGGIGVTAGDGDYRVAHVGETNRERAGDPTGADEPKLWPRFGQEKTPSTLTKGHTKTILALSMCCLGLEPDPSRRCSMHW
jgi:hypothetical protein